MDKGFAMCGTNAHRVTKIVSVRELLTELVDETLTALNDDSEDEWKVGAPESVAVDSETVLV